MQQYGGYNGGGGGGYGQTNPYEQQGSRYDQSAGNPYGQQAGNPYAQQQQAAPQAPYGGRHQQGGYDNQYGQGQSTGNGGYGKLGCLVLGRLSITSCSWGQRRGDDTHERSSGTKPGSQCYTERVP